MPYCQYCGYNISANDKLCLRCGKSTLIDKPKVLHSDKLKPGLNTANKKATNPVITRKPNWIEPIAYIEISAAVLWLIAWISIVMSTGIASGFDEFVAVLGSLISITFLVMAVIGGIGLLKQKKAGRYISIIITALMSIVPISVFFGIPMLIYLLRGEVREYFELSEEEKRQINRQQQANDINKRIGHKRLSVSITGRAVWYCGQCSTLVGETDKVCPNCGVGFE